MTSSRITSHNRQGDSSFWPVDLHAHTIASDGTLSPEELVELASSRNMRVLAVTDHDTVDAIPAARRRASEFGITLIPGVELSTTERRSEVHVLGYGVDVTDDVLRRALSDLAAARVRRITSMIEKLHDAGYAVDGEAILAQADEGSIGRPHVARALIDIGAVASINEAFERFLKPGRPGWIPREPFTPEQAVSLLVEHDIVPVLAHPFSTGDIDAVLGRLIPLGLKGMEVWYGHYDQAQRETLRQIAESRGLVATGGSDFHGPDVRSDSDLGEAPVPYEVFERLVEAGVRV